MPTLQLRACGPAPVDLVWARYADPERWADWSPQIRAVRTPVDRIEPAARGTVVGPLGVRVPFEVLEVDASARTWRWRVRLGPATVDLDHAVRQVFPSGSGPGTGPDRTLTTLALSGPLPALLLLVAYAPLAQLALRRLVTP